MVMRVDFSALRLMVSQMGAETSDFTLNMNIDAWEPLDTELMEGIEVNIDDIDIDHGILSYKGRQVLLYIQDHRNNVRSVEEDGSRGRKFHVADCETLQEMREAKRFERYVATNDLSGSFYISGKDWRTGKLMEGTAELKVCKNCLSKLNYKGYVSDGRKSEIFNRFSLGEFFSTYSSFFKYMPKCKAGTESNDNYTEDWPVVTKRYKEKRNHCCEQCKVDLSQNKHLLHTHHVNGVKKDNSEKNLRALCSDCHRREPMHGYMFVRHEDTQLINKLRREQIKLSTDNWTEVIELSDPAVHGLIRQCESSQMPVPEVGFELQGVAGDIVAELELAWPSDQIGVAISEYDRLIAERQGWTVWGIGDALDKFGQFRWKVSSSRSSVSEARNHRSRFGSDVDPRLVYGNW